MATGKHYYIEHTKDQRFAVRAKGSERASVICNTQERAVKRAHEFNPHDHPDISRVRHTRVGEPDQWRGRRSQ